MELSTQRSLDSSLCSSTPLWSLRNGDGAVLIRFDQTIVDDATGYLCYELDGVKGVKSFSYYPNNLPNPLPTGAMIAYFINRLNEETKLNVKFLSWSEDVKHVKASALNYLLTVGTEILCYERIDSYGHVLECAWRNGYSDKFKKLSAIASLQNSFYSGPLCSRPREQSRVKIVNVESTQQRSGVFLTEKMGAELASNASLDEAREYDVVFINFPLDTKIISVEYLTGLLLEVYCQAANVEYFRNRYRLVGASHLREYLNEFIEKANVIKKGRMKDV